MSDSRKILKALMVQHGHSGHRLENLSGVPSATTNRFLRGEHKEPTGATFRKWAKVYGITETQLRGYEPIQGVLLPAEPKEGIKTENDGFPHLTREEKAALKVLRRIKEDSKRAWLKIGMDLAGPSKTEAEAEDIRTLIAETGSRRSGVPRRSKPDRRMGNGPAYGPAKHQAGLAEKGKRA
jgi:transcriptional regulator with XRE-family HTH domain